MGKGMLYICATPIGNLEDITLRVLRVLREADFIAAEDTRRTLGLLNHLSIKKPVVSYFQHNEKRRGAELVDRIINEGISVAVVTDAGTPCISDPGFELVRACVNDGIPVAVCPGASAATAAAALCGFDCGRFVFEGFLPAANKAKSERLACLRDEERAIILYESPKRVGKTLAELAETLGGERNAAVIKEMTKIYEKTERGTLKELSESFQSEQKGEFVIVIDKARVNAIDWRDMNVNEHIRFYFNAGYTLKDAMKAAAKDRGIAKSEIYNELLRKKAAD
jgi:16S rRNA (cytidine1402-2'-O)-methyltransferase